ncbi:3-deoxy-manno-octulosonate-8-phosphatase KdsC [uncultured Thiothrix sp.]|uniref:3-deoxy-manno-octulosonate-8-phosphatase KdsC n=1 Tax=uncultured Thiothrix sp. TaxID=223185 RepID=UPI0026089F98|nr:3-deoxy-manno-octulosonate-8-phosphatase KdsC [uncultured Thiothrix sp.]
MNVDKQLASKIELLILDVDGVLTDGSLFYDNHGQEYKAFNSRDGHGLRMLQDAGVKVAILTGRKSELVQHRAKNLNIPTELVFQGFRDKRPAFAALLEHTSLPAEKIAYIGDDVIDLPVMKQVGLAIAVADAHPFVKEHAHWVTTRSGGRGAVRETCEMLLDARGQLQAILDSYLR